MIVKLTSSDVSKVVHIHKNNLPSLINFYNYEFIEKFYIHHLNKQDETILIGYKENSELLGFVFGTLNIKDMFGSYMAKNKTYFIKHTFWAILKNPKYLLYIFQKFFSKDSQQDDSQVQLVYIAVENKYKSLGIGKKLLSGFEAELQKVKSYYELEVEQNNPAFSFYKSQNFTVVREINSILEKKFLMRKNLK